MVEMGSSASLQELDGGGIYNGWEQAVKMIDDRGRGD